MKALLTCFGKPSSAVIFFVYFLKVIGLAPFSIYDKRSSENSRHISTWAIKYSRLGLGYNIVVSILLPIIATFVYSQVLAVDYVNKSTLTQVTDTAQSYLTIATAVIVLISWTVKQRKAISIIDRLLDNNRQLFCMEIRPSYKKTLILLSVHFVLNAFLWTFYWAMSSVVYSVDIFPNSIFALLPSIVVCWHTIEYSMIIGLITMDLKSVNKNLLKLTKIMNYPPSNPLSRTYSSAFNSSVQSQLTILYSLQSIRTSLVEISRDIADFFSFSMLPCFASFFLMFVCNVYYLITPLVAPNGAFDLTEFSVTMVWVLICIYCVASLSFSVTEILHEAKLTGRIVHKLLASSISLEVKEQLQYFSLQLLHEDFNFTAYGFFTLDLTLLHTMLGSAATYIVICIQFQQ